MRKAALVLVGSIGVAAILVGLNVHGLRQRLFARTPRQGRPQIRSLAVLPIENLSGDLSQDFLAGWSIGDNDGWNLEHKYVLSPKSAL